MLYKKSALALSIGCGKPFKSILTERKQQHY